MGEVERLLTAAMVEVAPVDPAHPHGGTVCARTSRSSTAGSRRASTPRSASSPHEEDLRPPAGLLLVATLGEDPVGGAALRLHDDAPAEVKRMWVAGSARGLGIGRRLLAELEAHAADHGARAVRPETNGTLVEAIGLYRSAGYVEVPPSNDEPYANYWFDKTL